LIQFRSIAPAVAHTITGRASNEWEVRLINENDRKFCEVKTIRFVIRAKIPTEAGNRMLQDPNGFKALEDYIAKVKPEAVYFYEEGGERTGLFVVDVASADMIPVIAEPLFQGVSAKVEFHPAMTPDEVKRGLQKVK